MTMTPECFKAYSAWLADPCRYAAGGFGFEYAWNAALKWRDAQTGSADPFMDKWFKPAPDAAAAGHAPNVGFGYDGYVGTSNDPAQAAGCRPLAPLTADDVRRIVREELQAIDPSLPDLP